jgi:hypothetical protein
VNSEGEEEYHGTGKTCQAWDSQTPHKHGNSPAKKPTFGLEGNLCRNPDDSDTIWCYTTDPNKRWEYCDPINAERKATPVVSKDCATTLSQETLTGKNKDLGYRGSQTKTKKGETCLDWDDQSVRHRYTSKRYPKDDLRLNFCRNPGKSARTAWCWTGMKGNRKMWGYCNEVKCGDPERLNDKKGIGYRGKQVTTRSGKTC